LSFHIKLLSQSDNRVIHYCNMFHLNVIHYSSPPDKNQFISSRHSGEIHPHAEIKKKKEYVMTQLVDLTIK
jgi:hypothetical protein